MRVQRILVFFLAICATAAHAQSGRNYSPADKAPLFRAFMTADSGYLIENPQLMAGPEVKQVSISADGAFVLALQNQHYVSVHSLEERWQEVTKGPAGATKDDLALTVWSARTKRAKTIWHSRISNDDPDAVVTHQVQIMNWFGRSSVAIGMMNTMTQGKTGNPVTAESLLIIDAAKETVREVPINGSFYPDPSPTQPFAILRDFEGDDRGSVRFVGPDGVIGEPIALPGYLTFTRWSPDGNVVWGKHGVPPAEKWYAVNPVARAVTEILEPPKKPDGETDFGSDSAPEPTDLPFHLTSATVTGTDITSVWLESAGGKDKILLSGEGEAVAVTKYVALFRLYGGALYAAPIIEIGAAAVARLSRAKARSEALTKARSIGRLLASGAMVARSNLFPATLAEARTKFAQVGDPTLFDQFTYSPPPGQALTKRGATPVAIGYFANGFGRAIVYSDGSAAWEDGH